MKGKPVLIFCSVITLLFSIGYLFAPGDLISLFGLQTDRVGHLAIQFIGALGIGYVVIIITTIRMPAQNQKPILGGILTMMAISTIISFTSASRQTLGSLGWAISLMFLLTFVVFGYYYIKTK